MKAKKEKANQHVYGVFLRILKKCKNNSRIAVIELPSGDFKDGVIPTNIILKVKLRHIISVDLKDVRPVKNIDKLVFNDSYNKQPSVYPSDVDENLG
jgi:hypothetical protein